MFPVFGSTTPTIGASVDGGTAGRILYVGAGPVLADSANLTFNPTGSLLTLGTDAVVSRYAAKKIMISGDGTGAASGMVGWIIGNIAAFTSGLWNSTVTPSSSNFTLYDDVTNTIVNGSANVYLRVGNSSIQNQLSISNVAGAGPSITAGTATTDVNALSLTQTWNAAGVAFTGLKFTITDTASAAGALAMQILGGASGTTNLMSLSKGGFLTLENGITSTGVVTVNDGGGGGIRVSNAMIGVSVSIPISWSVDGNSNNTKDTGISRISAGILGVGTGAAGSTAGTLAANAYLTGGVAAAATTEHKVIKKVTGIADNTATDVFTVTVPNANHAAAVKITLLSSNGSTDAFESSRVAVGTVVLARTTGANVSAAVSTLTLAQIATVAAGATHTLAYGVSAISGAVGATNTFTIQVTIDDSGNTGANQVVAVAELVNAEATGVTIA